MNTEPEARRGRLWIYAVLPAVVLNLAGCAIFGAYYGLAAQRPELVAAIGGGHVFFALIHGFLPGKLLVTFLLGVVGGFYYTRERNLVPLMLAHGVVDVWSFGLSAYG